MAKLRNSFGEMIEVSTEDYNEYNALCDECDERMDNLDDNATAQDCNEMFSYNLRSMGGFLEYLDEKYSTRFPYYHNR